MRAVGLLPTLAMTHVEAQPPPYISRRSNTSALVHTPHEEHEVDSAGRSGAETEAEIAHLKQRLVDLETQFVERTTSLSQIVHTLVAYVSECADTCPEAAECHERLFNAEQLYDPRMLEGRATTGVCTLCSDALRALEATKSCEYPHNGSNDGDEFTADMSGIWLCSRCNTVANRRRLGVTSGIARDGAGPNLS